MYYYQTEIIVFTPFKETVLLKWWRPWTYMDAHRQFSA